MTWWTELVDWSRYNYAYYVFALMVLLIILLPKLRESWEMKKQKSAQGTSPVIASIGSDGQFYSPEINTPMGGIDAHNTLNYFGEQKELAAKWLAHLETEGKSLAKNEQILDIDYRNRKTSFMNKRKILGLKYSGWANQLQTINTMIETQKQLEEETRKLQ